MISIVVPTLGRPSLGVLLNALALPHDAEVLVVDDRPWPAPPLTVPRHVKVLTGPAAGPAAARNTGWRAARHDWVAFLDDDVVPDEEWFARLDADLAVAADVGGVQGRLRVPLPAERRPTDWERVTAGLADGAWITADMAYRRAALEAVGGFDERFRRAFREDAEIAYRIRTAGWRLIHGTRTVTHPVRPEDRWVSVRTQRGNADDALLRRLYGRRWRDLLQVPPGRRSRHVAVTVAGITAMAGAGLACAELACAELARAASGRTGPDGAGPGRRRIAAMACAVAGAVWLAGTAEFAAARIAPGPRTRAEVTTMVATSVIIPPLAVAHWLRGWWRHRNAAEPDAAAQPGTATQPGTAQLGTAHRDTPRTDIAHRASRHHRGEGWR